MEGYSKVKLTVKEIFGKLLIKEIFDKLRTKLKVLPLLLSFLELRVVKYFQTLQTSENNFEQ